MAAVLLLAAVPGGDVRADPTILTGSVIDSASGRPLVGSEVRILRATTAIGQGPTDPDGRFQIQFEGNAQLDTETLSLRAEHQGYAPRQINFQMVVGQPFQPPSQIALLSDALAGCKGSLRHTVVIGNFRSPTSGDIVELPGRIADALQFDLTTRLQQTRLASSLQPVFAPCEGARPDILQFSKSLAQALGADALVYGYVARATANFKVSTYVIDSYDVFLSPKIVSSEAVNLDDPESARMSTELHAAILSSLASGIAAQGSDKCAEVISVINAIQQLEVPLLPALESLRATCSTELPNNALLLDGGGN